MMKYCPQCGSPVQQDAQFCSSCGRRLASEELVATTEGKAQEVVAREPFPVGSAKPSGDRTWAILVHLSAFAGLLLPLLGNILAPLVIWLLKREDPLVDLHGKEALNFNISIAIYSVICFILIFVLIGIPLSIGLFFFWLIVVIVAAVRAGNGQNPGYPLAIRFFR